jgi:uncharacterized membrane protein (UPF0127 family)
VTTLAAAALAALAFPHATVQITTAHRPVTVRVEIAQTDAQREQGLMNRRTLAPRAGMLFTFPVPTRGAFWMKDTLIPLSIAFADGDGRILAILDMAPCRADPCRVYDPHVAFSSALEVNRGAFRRWGVRVGSRIALRRTPLVLHGTPLRRT